MVEKISKEQDNVIVSYGWHFPEYYWTNETAKNLQPLVSDLNITFCDMTKSHFPDLNKVHSLTNLYCPPKKIIKKVFELVNPKFVIDIHSYAFCTSRRAWEETTGKLLVSRKRTYNEIKDILSKEGLVKVDERHDISTFNDASFDKRFTDKIYPALEVKLLSKEEIEELKKDKNFIGVLSQENNIPYIAPEVTNPEQMAIYLNKVIRGMIT